MQWLLSYATRVAVRRVVTVLVLLVLAWAGIGRADAAVEPCTAATCDREEAYSRCMAALDEYVAARPTIEHQNLRCIVVTNAYEGRFQFLQQGNWGNGQSGRFPFRECPSGTEWSDISKTCHNRNACLDKSAMGSGTIGATATSACIGGCAYGPAAGEGATTLSFDGVAFVSFTKGWVPSGEACSDSPPADEQQCTPLASGQTACAKPDGKICYSAGGGVASQFCWNPGETGEKTDGDKMQKTNAGDQPIPPANMSLPSGDSLVPVGNPINTTINNNGKTTNTTTNNYNTQHGTDAGTGPGQAEPGDGSGKPAEEGDGDKGTVSGGESCAAPPACSGNALACWAIRSNWRQGCEGVASGIEGMAELGDAINRATEADAVEWGALLGNDGDGDLDAAREVRMIDPGELDASGFLGGGSCPNFPMPTVAGQTINIDFTQICGFLSNIGSMVLALSYLLGFRIIVGGGSK